MQVAFISIENVGKTYNETELDSTVQVLADISVDIQEGEFIALMGPSGSGKSTLLTIIGAMNRPSTGKVMVDGIDVYGLSDERRADFRMEYLGFVFQQHHLMPYLTALENAMLPLATSRVPTREKRERARAVLESVSLGNKASRLPNQLSGGEQGRLAIARALVNQPPLLLADEPTGTLDSKTGCEIMEVFIELNRQGQTIFMVTHNQDNADLADRVLQIRDGSLVNGCVSRPDRTKSGPASSASRNESQLGGIYQQDAQRRSSGAYVVNAG
jgi:putative ABC transport system ATP-binding protein